MNTLVSRWTLVDSGIRSAAEHMNIDRDGLSFAAIPILRFFEWKETVVTYGYLMNSEKVKEWGESVGCHSTVQRPTGGGVVLHTPKELAVSLVWPRGSGILPEDPRSAYTAIHKRFMTALMAVAGNGLFGRSESTELRTKSEQPVPYTLYAPERVDAGNCSTKQFSVCFQEPVCNDVMRDGKKIIGGALRLTKYAILYQGSIQIPADLQKSALKPKIAAAFESF